MREVPSAKTSWYSVEGEQLFCICPLEIGVPTQCFEYVIRLLTLLYTMLEGTCELFVADRYNRMIITSSSKTLYANYRWKWWWKFSSKTLTWRKLVDLAVSGLPRTFEWPICIEICIFSLVCNDHCIPLSHAGTVNLGYSYFHNDKSRIHSTTVNLGH